MSLFKRKDSSLWWVKIEVNGKKIQKSTGTADRKQAQEYHDRLKSELWEQSRLGVKPEYLWEEAVKRFLQETSHKASHQDDVDRLKWIGGLLNGVKLSEINRTKLDAIITAKRVEGAKNGTINRHLAVINTVLRKAMREWEWIDKVPTIKLLPEPKRRIRWLTREEAERLLKELPAHLIAMVRFSLETGLRQSNVTGLLWSQVDLERKVAWIHPDQAKARKAIGIPLSDSAVSVLKSQIGKHPTHVFSFKGKAPVIHVNNGAWGKALKRAGIEDFRWHDLRHTWASWHIQNGTPLHVLQELGGWEGADMVRRYAHLSGEHLANYARNLT